MVSKMIPFLTFLLCVSSENKKTLATLQQERDSSREEGFESLAKSPIKTIKLKGGDIIDCVDFYKQPTFENPLLKDHKILKLPESYASRRRKQLEKKPGDEHCPFGTVPIPRSGNSEVHHIPPAFASNAGQHSHQVGVYMKQRPNLGFRGGSGSVSIYNLTTGNRQTTRSNIWVQLLPQYIVVGIQVGLDDDHNPRLFTYWTNDSSKGCWNFMCKGFVQVDSEIGPGHLIEPVSTYGGFIHDYKITIRQDEETLNWVLYFLEDDIVVGYFPNEILPDMGYGVTFVAWGADARSGDDGITPPMGSGHKPDGQYNHAAYFKKLVYIDDEFVAREASSGSTDSHTDGSNCFGLQNATLSGPYWGYSFLFGGPGGQCG